MRTWRPENNNLEKLEKKFKRSIMFFSSMNFGPDSEGEDRDQEQIYVMNNFLEEENEESVNHTLSLAKVRESLDLSARLARYADLDMNNN